MRRAFPARTAVLAACLAVLLPVTTQSPELRAAPPPFAEPPAHFYEIAEITFISQEDRIFRAQQISRRVSSKTHCSALNHSYEVLIQKNDPAMEIIYLRAANNTMYLHTHWGDVEDMEVNHYSCSTTPIPQCLSLLRDDIAADILRHDECVHQGGKSCSPGSH
jgi:hypothetical protein